MRKYVVLVIALSLVGSALLGAFLQRKVLSRDAQNLAYYQATYLQKQGWSSGFGTYDLRSFDGGQRWYAVESDPDGGLMICGASEDVFPGLMAHLEGMDALISYAQKNGPVTLSGSAVDSERVLLEAAGFQVQEK